MKGFLALLLAICFPLVAGCAEKAEAPEGSANPSPTTIKISPRPTATPPPTAHDAIDIPYPGDLETATVTRVIDGDTINVFLNGNEFTVRYIGIDTPETVDPNRPDGCYGEEASARNKELVLGRAVGLERDVSETDDFGRLLRYVWIDRQMVNALLVRDGYAKAETDFPEVKHRDVFLELQTAAQEAGRGLWGEVCANATPIVTRTQTPPPGTGDEICEFSGTTQPVIKGNISSSMRRSITFRDKAPTTRPGSRSRAASAGSAWSKRPSTRAGANRDHRRRQFAALRRRLLRAKVIHNSTRVTRDPRVTDALWD